MNPETIQLQELARNAIDAYASALLRDDDADEIELDQCIESIQSIGADSETDGTMDAIRARLTMEYGR